LIFDSHRFYITQPFIDYCWEHQIRPFLLPAHNIYLLQPLDIGVFQTIKSNFKKVVQREIFNSATDISKVDFFSFYQQFYNRTFRKPSIYKSEFCRTGLILYNPLIVLEKMKEYQGLQAQLVQDTVERPSSLLLSLSIGFSTPPP
jgi:hypothetical protein